MSTVWEDIEILEKEELKGTINRECVVIGGGLAGIMTAYELKSRGFSVVILDGGKILSGATKGTTAKITPQHGLIYGKLSQKIKPLCARLYYDSQREGAKKIEALVKERGISCDFKRENSYFFSRDNVSELIKEGATLSSLGIDVKFRKKTGLPFYVKGALCMEDSAVFHPVKFAKALSEDLEIYEKSPVVKIRGNRVITPKGEVLSKYIIICTHYPVINFPGLYFLRQHQEKSYLLAMKTDQRVGGIYLSDEGLSLRDYEEGVLIGGMAHRTGGNKKGGCYLEFKRFAKEIFPKGEIVGSWSNQDAMTHDGLPFIGKYSILRDNIFVATGFNKWGMSNSAVASSIIPDLIEGKENKYEKLYTPQRLHIKAGFSAFLCDVGYSVKGLSSGLFAGRDKRCTHLGCKLYENPDEKTLECPCHGSEFTKAGEVLFSPAKRPIRKRLM